MYAPMSLVLPFASALVAFIVTERLVNAILSVFMNDGGKLRFAMSMQFLFSLIDIAVQAMFTIFYAGVNIGSALLGSLMWALALITLGAVFYVTYEHSPVIWTSLIRSYNAFLGPLINGTIIQGLDLFNTVFKGLIPIYNSYFFFFSRLISGYFVPLFFDTNMEILQFGLHVFRSTKALCFSSYNWVQYAIDCPESSGDACFDVATRTMDFITPMKEIRDGVASFSRLAHVICGTAAPIVDAVTYPFMDVNLASAVHNVLNAFLYFFFQMPQVTYLRCTRHKGEEPLMCTPDGDPVYAFLAAGLRDFGHLLNNWLNIIFVIIQSVLGWDNVTCESVLAPSVLDPGDLREAMFGSNQTALVGLTGWLMAVTDGYTVAYQGQGSTRVSVWPRVVNISHGVAAVTFGKSSDLDVTSLSTSARSGTSTSLFGCACVSDGTRIQIQCAVLPYSGLLDTESGYVPLMFQEGSNVETVLKCADLDITVQSVRWPATRFATGGQVGAIPDCTISRTCNKVDASVWVVPRAGCDAESTLCSCYPFCMAVRLAGSQAAPMVLYSAEQWRSKVYAVQRDCNLHSISESSVFTVASALKDTVSGIFTTQPRAVLTALPQFVETVFSGGGASCVDSQIVSSLIDRNIHPAYDTPTPAFLRNRDAPFVISGDTILTSVKHGDGTYSVRIERLTGAAGNEFTLSVVSATFPAVPPPSVPSALFNTYPKDHLTTPYARQSTLAVSSRAYVFYAVNPATEVYQAYLDYCRNDGVGIDKFGIIMVSSYSPIRVWRVDAYRRCSVSGCGSDLIAQVDLPGAFSDGTLTGTSLSFDCVKDYTDAIVQLEYINEFNIAITTRYTNVQNTFTEYRTYWLHVETMRLSGPGLARQGPWTEDVPVTAYSAYALCPAMQRLPELGSLAMELVVAGVFLLKMPLDAVVYFPGIFKLWSKGSVCPMQTRGHSILQQCGAHTFSLDDFFDSLQTATNIFWSSLALAAGLVHELNPTPIDFVENVLKGAARFGVGSIDLWSARFQVVNMLQSGPKQIASTMPTAVWLSDNDAGKMTELAQGSMKMTGNTLGWARYGYSCAVKTVVGLIQRLLTNQEISARQGWQLIVNSLDERRDYFDTYVIDNLRQSCAGFALMLGLNNPWAILIYKQCLAANTLIESGIDVFLAIFNLAPFAQCMCSDATGRIFAEHALYVCLPQASERLRPVLLQMVQTARLGNSPSSMCTQMLAYTKTELNNAVQPWFDSQFASMDALASSVDYAMAWFDSSSGKCLDFQGDPYVVVLMPHPTDYFHACGATSLCRSKCSGVFDAFDASLAGVSAPFTIQKVAVKVESLFFPTMSTDAVTPMKIYAVIEPTPKTCFSVCGRSKDICVAIAGTTSSLLRVQYYCVPIMVSATVYRTQDLGMEWFAQGSGGWWNDLIQVQFADTDGLFIVALTSTGDLYMASSISTKQISSTDMMSDAMNGKFVLSLLAVITIFKDTHACVSVNVRYRMADGKITSEPAHMTLVIDKAAFPPDNEEELAWELQGKTGFFERVSGYSFSSYFSADVENHFLLLPTLDGAPMATMTVEWDSNDVMRGIRFSPLPTITLTGTPSGLGSLLSAGQPLSQNCVRDAEGAFIAFSAAPYYQQTSWLTQVRVSSTAASTFTSQPAFVDVETTLQCGVNTCLGCPDGEVQRLCDAVQQCAVINCIGTPVNMRRVLCQIGQTVADELRETLALLNGLWVVFIDMFMMIMNLSFKKSIRDYALTWPDDRFFGYVCTIKDRNAHLISIVTSSLNTVLQLGHSSMVYLLGRAHDIDSNFNAMTTLPLTALTSFFHQLMLLPLYPLIIAQKVMICNTNGFLAVFDASGFSIRVGKADMEQASSNIVGHCLTEEFVSESANPTDSSNSQSVGRVVAQTSKAAVFAMVSRLTFRGFSLEFMMHYLDGIISYLMGVVSGMQDFMQALDVSHCKLPDYFLNQTVFCACGDSAYSIPDARRAEGFHGPGFWCTGTLSLVDSSNQQFVVYNPFTYQELQNMATSTDAYLACVSSKVYVYDDSDVDCHSLRPTTETLSAQGVSVLTVLTACKSNYAKKQWDSGAYVLFNKTAFSTLVQGVDRPVISQLPAPTRAMENCFTDPVRRNGCLSEFLTSINTSPDVYWSYIDLEDNSPSPTVDACQVFTGPASSPALTDTQLSTFRACLDDYADSNCQLSSSLWTPQSDNVVPVAYRHAVKVTQTRRLDTLVQLKYEEAHRLVMDALTPLADYNNPEVLSIFFSPEGDIMHQMMDCVFMGPYSSVNYWPSDSLGTLPIPKWFRDANGTSRSIDPRGCLAGAIDKEPPYSCGSHSRQAVIKHFFRDYLQNQEGATIKSIVTAMVGDLTQAWSNMSNYPCLCEDTISHSMDCCGLNASTWIPRNLDVEYQALNTTHVLRALTKQLQNFYRFALEDPEVWTKHLDASTLGSYDWSVNPHATVATDEALFKTQAPLIRYDSSEVNSPFTNNSALWTQCHGLLSQIIFTIPMTTNSNGQWVPRGLPSKLEGTDGLHAFIRAAVDAAFQSSPLYRHYNVSHIPSNSRLCRTRSGGNTPVSPRAVRVSDYTYTTPETGTISLLNTAGWSSMPAYGTDSFQMNGCFCGWATDGDHCVPPSAVCSSHVSGVVASLCPSFPRDSKAAVDFIKAHWDPAWSCPALSPSDHWAPMNAAEMDAWLLGTTRDYSVFGEDLLRRGRAGMRAGNFQSISNVAKATITPTRRTIEPNETVLPFCEQDAQNVPQKALLDADALRAFVSHLFPVAQGVHEPSTSAYCLRYSIEAALLAAMDLVASQWPASAIHEHAAQQLVVDKWKRRCESQITLLSLCKNLDVFKPPLTMERRSHACPFTINVRIDNDKYTTPGCLVHSGGVFYDPCRCPKFTCGPSKPMFELFEDACKITFDPRDMTSDAPLGGWIVSPIEVLKPTFASSILSIPTAAGNIPSSTGSWKSAEGFLKDTGLFCDMITDWWPEGETMPVGYHATVPCSSSETGYRTFDSAFAVERSDGYTVVKLVYQHDATRDAARVDTHFGVGGVCRGSNVGMPFFETNTMRLCTRQLKGEDTVDPAVPPLTSSTSYADSDFDAVEHCSTSSTSVPWFDIQGRHDSAMYSIGTIPNMPKTIDSTYPPSDTYFGIGPKNQILSDIAAGGTGWGAECSDYAIKECSSDTDCPSEFYCIQSAKICMSLDFKQVERCYRHDSCNDGMMCSGEGLCVDGYIYYLNSLNDTVEVDVYSEQCDGDTSSEYYTDGSSPWEYVPDWLSSHGMCSNKNWYAYQKNLDQAKTCALQACTTQTKCNVNPLTCTLPVDQQPWWDASDGSTKGKEPNIFAVKPTVCDRDYEHMLGPTKTRLRGCSPTSMYKNSIIRTTQEKESITYARLFRNYDPTVGSIANLANSQFKKTGYLGKSEADLSPSTVVNCDTFQNCYDYEFTFNGQVQQKRTYWRDKTNQDYTIDNIFKCGVFGYFDNNQCVLDIKVLPIYKALCKTDSVLKTCSCADPVNDAIGCSSVINHVSVQSICGLIKETYTPSYETIQANNRYIQDLFNVFLVRDGTLAEHVTGVECFEAIHSIMINPPDGPNGVTKYYASGSIPAGVYYPLEFALYEVPLAWVYQCVRMGGRPINPDGKIIDCLQYRDSKSLEDATSILRSADNLLDFSLVRVGYRRADVRAKYDSFITHVLEALPVVSHVSDFADACSDMNIPRDSCQLTPYCALRRDWVPKHNWSQTDKMIIASFYRGICRSSENRLFEFEDMGYSSFQEFLTSKTRLQDYQKDPTYEITRNMNEFIPEALRKCISMSYNSQDTWPLTMLFDASSSSFLKCMQNAMLDQVNTFNVELLDMSTYMNANLIYTPMQDVITPVNPDMNIDEDKKQCIFDNLREQNEFYHEPYTESQNACPFVNKKCNNVKCITYPLSYSTGYHNCHYPTSVPYNTLLSHLEYIWNVMYRIFELNMANKGAFPQPAPVVLSFFSAADASFPYSTWTFNTNDIRRYLSNIHPDISKEIMCTPIPRSQIINFVQCNDENWAALKAHTASMRQSAAPLLDTTRQLKWKVSREFLARGALFAFTGSARNDSDVLLQSIFNDNTRCGTDEKQSDRVCLLTSISAGYAQNVRPWVPWMSGEWNPYEFCDVRLLELNQGYQEEIWPYDTLRCKDCEKNDHEYRRTYMFDSKTTPNCDTRKNTYAKKVNVNPKAPTNLCYVTTTNNNKECAHPYGMVGGGRGQSVLNHPIISNLYGSHDFAGMGGAGLFPRSSGLFNGADAQKGEYGFLSVPGDELGIIGLALHVNYTEDDGTPYLRISRLPLKPPTGYMTRWDTKEVSQWVSSLATTFAAEDALHVIEQLTRPRTGWDCPLRKVAFYSQGINSSQGGSQEGPVYFSPAVPSPGRARRLFASLTSGLSTHPTQKLQRDGSALGSYTTGNGFCFCPSGMPSQQLSCLISIADTTHECSLKKTVDALKGQWVRSHVFTPFSSGGGASVCRMQWDWPYLKGELRDGSYTEGDYTWASDPLGHKCHMLDRLKPFLYRYTAANTISTSAGTTTDKGGVCHTGRAAQLTPTATAKITTTRCVKASETTDDMTISCEDGTKMTLNKEKSTPLPDMVQAIKSKRSKCNQCSPPPVFTDAARQTITPESSFGIPFRFSPSRAVAAELRRLLCGGSTCPVAFNEEAWTNEEFMSNLLTSPARLFASPSPALEDNTPLASTGPWDSEWVFCNTTDDLKAGTCRGKIPESDWRKNRFETCYKKIRELTRDNPDVMSSVDVCLIDAGLQNLCTAVKEAQTLVRQANCLASGSETCALKPFLYQPATWDTSNQEFVHQTVTRFYSRVTAYACPVVSDIVAKNNEAILSRCAAVPVGSLNVILRGCRKIVDSVAQIIFYAFGIVIDGLIMAFDSDKASRKAEIIYYWDNLKLVALDLLKTLGDLFFDMLFHMGPLGGVMFTLMQESCGFINTAYHYWLTVWCGIAIDLAPGFLGGLRQAVEFSETAFAVLNDVIDVVFEFMVPSALGRMISMGYDLAFRDRDKDKQKRSKQEIKNTIVKSKSEGLSLDAQAKSVDKVNTEKYVLGNRGGSASKFKKISSKTIAKDSGKSAMGATAIGGGIITLLDIGQIVYDAKEYNRLADLYPGNWTFFDFSPIYFALDLLEFFVTSDEKCMRYREFGDVDILSCSFPPLARLEGNIGALDLGTRCWADVQRDVGMNNLLACSPSDTCYKSINDLTPIVCASCPDNGEGYSLYGCSPVTKTCTCSIATTQTTSCTRNEECVYATTVCTLMTGIDSLSFGNMPCSQCNSKEVTCLMRSGESIGQCSCMYQTPPLQTCEEPLGNFVHLTSPGKLCAYLPGANPRQFLAATYWESVAFVQCLNLDPSQVYCSRLSITQSNVIKIAVGIALDHTNAPSSSRRLLSENKTAFRFHFDENQYLTRDSEAFKATIGDDWNAAANPCKDLVVAYRGQLNGSGSFLGPLDTAYLQQCVYWRYVGRRTIERYNLTSLKEHDTFLLSVDDFAAALTRRSVLSSLLRHPQSLLFALSHTPMLKPIYASFLVLRSVLIARDFDAWNGTAWPEIPLHDSWERAWETVRSMPLWSPHVRIPRRALNWSLDEESFGDNMSEWEREIFEDPVIIPHNNSTNASHRRRLLLDKTTIQLTDTWLSGSFVWPPVYYQKSQYWQCSAGMELVLITRELLSVLVKYYHGSYTTPPAPSTSLRANMPRFPDVGVASSATQASSDPSVAESGDLTAWMYTFVGGLWGFDTKALLSFFGHDEGGTNVFSMGVSLFKCDYSAVQYCSKHNKDLFASAVLLLIFNVIVGYYARIIQIPFLSTWLFFFSIPILLWYVYGMALTCTPMVPTCFLDDLLNTLKYFLPKTMDIPVDLQVSADCLSQSGIRNCMKPCSDAPMLFRNWRDTLAWGACDVDVRFCRWLSDTIGAWDTLSVALTEKANILEGGTESQRTACRFCFVVTFVTVIPALVIIFIAVSSVAYVLYIPCMLLPRFFSLILQSIIFTHTGGDE